MRGYHLVPAEVVGRVVGSADHLDIELADEGLAAEFLGSELGIALFVDLAGGLGAQHLVDAEHAAEL